MTRKSNSNFIGLVLLGAGVFIILNEIKRARWCGPNCQTFASDAQTTLIEDLAKGIFG